MDASECLPSGSVLGDKYRIERLIGEGGMGAVYEATHLHLQKRVAVKVMLKRLAARPDMVARVVREAQAASATGHPNVVMVTDMGYAEQAPFIVMELLDGQTLEAMLERRPFGWRDAVKIVVQVLDGLEAVHAAGVVHRDLKPQNIMIARTATDRRQVKLLDFGISKFDAGQGPSPQTQEGQPMGTPLHMSPEQARGEPDIDHRTDLHATGTVLYTLIAGHSPFEGPHATATLTKVLEGRFVPLAELDPSVPAGLDAVLRRAMAVDRNLRFPDAASMRDALEAVLESPSTSPPVEPWALAGVAPGDASSTRLSPSGSWPEVAPAMSAPASSPWPDHSGPKLELDIPADWDPARAATSTKRTRGRGAAAILVVVVVLAVGGLAVVLLVEPTLLGEPLEVAERRPGEAATHAAEADDDAFVDLDIEATPSEVRVFVDGVLHDERPIAVPRSDDYVRLTVEADGHAPRVISVQPTVDRRLKVALERSRPK